jgi:hypothetical protein
MSLGELLDRTFTVYKGNFWLFATIMLLPYLFILVGSVFLSVAKLLGTQTAGAAAPISPAATGAGVLAVIALGIVYLAMNVAAQAATVFAVSDIYLGRATGVRQAYSRVRGKIGRMILLLIMIGFAVMGGMLIGLAVMAGMFLLVSRAKVELVKIVLTGLTVIGGVFLLLVPGLTVLCRTAVAIPAAMLENVSARQALQRSFNLTKGFVMSIFLVFLFVIFLAYVAFLIFQFPILLAAGSLAKAQGLPLGMAILSHLGGFISGVLVGPIATIAFALIYYDLRVRKEAFDLELLMAALGPGAASPA